MFQQNQEDISAPTFPHYNATVIGAGPAGLAIVGKLLDGGLDSILWVDPYFNAGRLSHYPEVPSNTKVKFFLQYIGGSTAFKEAIRTFKECNPNVESIFDLLERMDHEKGALLSHTIEMVKTLTEILTEKYKGRLSRKFSTVTKIEGKMNFDWTLETEDGSRFMTDLVFLATGSTPNGLEDCHNPMINRVLKLFSDDAKEISLDLSLYPSKLAETIKPEDTVAIIGSSHSAILALKNVVELPGYSRPKKIYNFYSSELRYAAYMDGWILYDNTGLKGEVAEWAKENLSQERSIEGLTRLKLSDVVKNEGQYIEELKAITASTLLIGFKRNKLPQMIINNEIMEEEQISYDENEANLMIKRDIKVPSIFGYGIAFPEKVMDPYGNVEHAVGLWKFMKHALKTVPPVVENYLKRNHY